MTRDDTDPAGLGADNETPDQDLDDDLDYDENIDYTYFCVSCGHEQFEGDICEACGSDDWEFVRLDEEGLQRLADVRGEIWPPDSRHSTGTRGRSTLTPVLQTTLDTFLDELTTAMVDMAGAAEPDAATTDPVDGAPGAETSPEAKEVTSTDPTQMRLAAEERLSAWIEMHHDWFLEEVAQAELEAELGPED